MRLTKNKILSLFVENDYITTRMIMDEFSVSMNTASTQLRRLVRNGVLEAQFGDNNSYWYSLIDREISGKTVIQRVIKSWQGKKHPNLKNIPESWGGSRRGGSGHLSAIKLFVKELVELGLIKD